MSWAFQSPIGWGLSCEYEATKWLLKYINVSIPYWLGSKLRDWRYQEKRSLNAEFQSPIGWGLSCE